MRLTATRLIIAGSLMAGVLVAAGCKKEASKNAALPPPDVTVSKPESGQVTDYFEFPGQTAAVKEVEIRSRVTGYLVKVNFADGQNVKEGDLLYEIDPRPYQAALDLAQGELARLRAFRVKLQINVDRSKRLRPSGAVSEDEYEQHVANLAVNDASIQSAEATVRNAELNLEFTKIRSPIDGRVSRTRITEGNYIQPGTDNVNVLTTVVSTTPIYVYFNIDEPTLLQYEELAFRQGRELHPDRLKDLKFPVEIGLSNEEGFPHVGILDFADNKIDRTTGTLRARGVFGNEKEYLTPGLFVRVRIPFGDTHQALMVSERALGTDQRQKFVLAVNKDNVVEYRRVKVGRLQNGLRVIESGIGPDDRIIVKGLQRARAGEKVTPIEAERETAASPSASSLLKADPPNDTVKNN